MSERTKSSRQTLVGSWPTLFVALIRVGCDRFLVLCQDAVGD